MRTAFFCSVLTAALAAAPMAMADSDDDYKGGPGVPRDQWMSASDVIQKLSAQGYKVTEIDADDGTYEFEARDASGGRVEGRAHPTTGEVISARPDHDD
ncbi:MAG: PepSY domain-containing protein [Hyphomicrobium sp.]|nr:PepSY domain-containing protein [Hyphomicrobium sp.]